MGTLVLVRHGQASFFDADYDKLSATGERQATLLGEHWARSGTAFDRVFHGPRRRQRRTAELVAEVMRAGGRPLPELVPLEGLDEVQTAALAAALPELTRRDPELALLLDDLGALAERRAPSRQFERRIARVLSLWARGEAEVEGVETFPDFLARVRGALEAMRRDAARGLRVLGFTSAGTISAAMGSALSLSPETAVDLMWRVRNTSVTEFLFSGDRFSMQSFNGVPHLADGALVTTL